MKWLVFCLLLLFACASAPEDVVPANISTTNTDFLAIEESVGYAKVREIDVGLSTFLIEGYMLGIADQGRFERLIGKVELDSNDNIVGVAGAIYAQSFVTDTRIIDGEIKDDVLLASEHEVIMFESRSIDDGVMRGELTFRGVTKDISIPVVVTETVRGEFTLDLTEFGVQKQGFDNSVLVQFDLVYKPR